MIAIIAACGANFASVAFAIERLGKSAILTTDPQVIRSASHVILPGVGTASQAMGQLEKLNLLECIRELTQPTLGICLGMQILFDHSEEGDVDCLGIIPGNVTALPALPGFTLPHMGWNQIKILRDSPLLRGVDDGAYAYYVHGFAAPVNEYTLATTDYTKTFAAVVQRNNFYGAQFHPERSSDIGASIIKNFLELS